MASHAHTTYNRRQRRVRYAVKLKANGKPRLSVHRSGQHIYVQLINDMDGRTLASASTMDKELKNSLKSTSNIEAAKAVGALIAKRAKDVNVEKAVFDRGGNLYHGRVKALADAAREAGLQF